jgi:hypothetical protein
MWTLLTVGALVLFLLGLMALIFNLWGDFGPLRDDERTRLRNLTRE